MFVLVGEKKTKDNNNNETGQPVRQAIRSLSFLSTVIIIIIGYFFLFILLWEIVPKVYMAK